jgi:hypothetical protein
MARSITFHSPLGGADFIGLRESRKGETEIVYDDGVARRMVWRVTCPRPDLSALGEAMSRALTQTRVVPALHAELRRRAIQIEMVVG